MKKIIFSFVFALLAFTLCAGNGQLTKAADTDSISQGICGDDLTWEFDDGILTIDGTGAMYDYFGYKTAPWHAFRDEIQEVVIEKGVTDIGECPFYDCSNLTSIEVAAKNGSYSSENGILYDKTKATLVSCPAGKTGKVSVHNGTTLILREAFKECSKVTSIYISDDVNTIKRYPEEVYFADCSSLTSFEVSDDNATYSSWDGMLCSKGKGSFYCCPQKYKKEVTISPKCTKISDGAFTRCQYVTSITVPAKVATIGYAPFLNSGVETIVFEEGVKKLPASTFKGCSKLKTITLPESMTTFESGVLDPLSTDVSFNVVKNSAADKYIKAYYSGSLDPDQVHTHDYEEVITKATLTANGSVKVKCSDCGNIASTTIIYRPKTISISKTSYNYNGTVRKPTVTVKDTAGKKISASNYSVKYSNASSKKVGKYTVTVTFKGSKYEGSKKLSYTILPKTTTLTSVTAGTKSFTATWTKKTTQVSGYQIDYSTSTKFKTHVIVGAKTKTSKTVTGLKAKKKYYVRVRTYKIVNGEKIHSVWSDYKKVTTK